MKKVIKKSKTLLVRYWRRGLWQKIVVSFTAITLIMLGSMYGIAQWYIFSNRNKPDILGVSFIPAYAESLGLNPQETMDALINDLGVRHFRLVSYWDQLEPQPGQYDFSLLDWQFKKAEASGSKITLSLGLRQPRWPECHMPGWAMGKPVGEWQPSLEAFIRQIVDRYKDSPALDSYQLENEFLLKGFGLCNTIPNSMARWRLIDELQLVKKQDPQHKVIIARSNNAIGFPIGKPTPDEFGVSIYKRVWGNPPGRYLEYPFPAWFYAFLAGGQKILTGKDMIIHELQAEAWPPNMRQITQVSLEEQNKSFDAERFEGRFKLMEGTGMHEAYLWGAEYWYYRLVHEKDTSVWNVAKKHFKQASHHQ
jgi:hypothetical protein